MSSTIVISESDAVDFLASKGYSCVHLGNLQSRDGAALAFSWHSILSNNIYFLVVMCVVLLYFMSTTWKQIKAQQHGKRN